MSEEVQSKLDIVGHKTCFNVGIKICKVDLICTVQCSADGNLLMGLSLYWQPSSQLGKWTYSGVQWSF